jgi:hypothetical protein
LCGWREAWEEAKDGREGRIGASMGEGQDEEKGVRGSRERESGMEQERKGEGQVRYEGMCISMLGAK